MLTARLFTFFNQNIHVKIFITGKHASGKHEVLNICEQMGLRIGREFSNLSEYNPTIYMDPNYLKYSQQDITNIFESHSYMYISGTDPKVIDPYSYFNGLSYYTYDNSDIMVVDSTHVCDLNKNLIQDDIVFVWMDNNRDMRIRRYAIEDRKYSFLDREDEEKIYDAEFVKTIYNFKNSNVLYFNNEEPERVAAIIAAIIKHNDLLDIFIKSFN